MSFLNLLSNLAIKSPMVDKIAAILVYKGKVISCGYNDYIGQTRRVNKNLVLQEMRL